VPGQIERATTKLLAKIEQGSGPVSRNRVRSTLSAFYSWCIKEGLCDVNPVAGTGQADEGGSRERVLTKDEIAKVWLATGLHVDFIDIVRLLLLTGQRREEIAGLRWSEIDFDAKLIRLPPARVKNNREHIVPLSKAAMEILCVKHSNPGPSNANDSRVFRGFSWTREKARLDAAINIAPYRLHDIRRSVATWLGELGFATPFVIEAILNHVSGHKAGVAGVYQRQRYENECRQALDKWAEYITTLVG
jgi:integrase